jgi:hypothetical protein
VCSKNLNSEAARPDLGCCVTKEKNVTVTSAALYSAHTHHNPSSLNGETHSFVHIVFSLFFPLFLSSLIYFLIHFFSLCLFLNFSAPFLSEFIAFVPPPPPNLSVRSFFLCFLIFHYFHTAAASV